MSTFVIDTENPRTVRAVVIAAGAASWQTVKVDGHTLYVIPSQSGGGSYLVSDHICQCDDFRRMGEHCKHVLAVRLHELLCEAEARHLTEVKPR